MIYGQNGNLPSEVYICFGDISAISTATLVTSLYIGSFEPPPNKDLYYYASLTGYKTVLQPLNVKRPFTILILNNGGGCIFEKLPISKTYDKFDAHFKLKHNNQLSPILSGMGLSCENIDLIDHLNTVEKSQKIIEVLL